MGFPFGSAVVSEHLHATEDEQRVLEILKKLLLGSVEVRRSKMIGHYGNPIIFLDARVNRRKDLKEFLHRIFAGLCPGELERLRSLVQDRVDDSCNFYLRFDKQLAQAGELALTDSGDAIHLRLKTVAFPAKREVAVPLVLKFLQDQEKHEG